MRFSMKFAAIAAVAISGLFASTANAAEVAYWNFNDFNAATVDAAARTAAFTADGGVNATSATMSTTATFSNGASTGTIGITHFQGTTENSVGGDPAGNANQALAIQAGNAVGGVFPNNGASITFGASTVGFNTINVSFATQRSASSGFNANQFAYSLDGVNFTNFGSSYDPSTAFGTAPNNIMSYDLSSISGLSDNPLAAFRITFNGATSASGNNRIDNLRIIGTATTVVPEAGTLALFAPALGVIGAVVVRRRKTA